MPETRDVFLLEAGPALAALVAERVMGAMLHEGQHETYMTLPGERPVSDQRPVPAYSTDIAAAWQVVEKLRDTREDDETFVNLVDCGGLGWLCTIEYNLTNNDAAVRLGEAQAPTAPLAICRAALAAVEAR